MHWESQLKSTRRAGAICFRMAINEAIKNLNFNKIQISFYDDSFLLPFRSKLGRQPNKESRFGKSLHILIRIASWNSWKPFVQCGRHQNLHKAKSKTIHGLVRFTVREAFHLVAVVVYRTICANVNTPVKSAAPNKHDEGGLSSILLLLWLRENILRAIKVGEPKESTKHEAKANKARRLSCRKKKRPATSRRAETRQAPKIMCAFNFYNVCFTLLEITANESWWIVARFVSNKRSGLAWKKSIILSGLGISRMSRPIIKTTQ